MGRLFFYAKCKKAVKGAFTDSISFYMKTRLLNRYCSTEMIKKC